MQPTAGPAALNFLIVFAALALTAPACGLIERSDRATNVEDDSLAEDVETIEVYDETKEEPTKKTETAPTVTSSKPDTQPTGPRKSIFTDPSDVSRSAQQIQAEPKPWPTPPATNPKVDAAEKLFEQAMRAQSEAAFMEALEHWKLFLARHTGMPGFEQAKYNYALTLIHLGRLSEAEEPLRGIIQTTNDPSLAIDARAVLAEAYLKTGKFDEALALTFDVLPDRKIERRMGIKRSATAAGVSVTGGKPTLLQRIKLFILRGRLFGSLGNHAQANRALLQAQKLLDGPAKDQLSQKERKLLSGTWSWRKIEVLDQICNHEVKVPDTLSEAEFLAYADAYYSCIAPARQLYCSVLEANDNQIEAQALQAYRRSVQRPLEISDRLPPPARDVRKKEQRGYYESEMKALISKTVEERSKAFRDIEACKALDVF